MKVYYNAQLNQLQLGQNFTLLSVLYSYYIPQEKSELQTDYWRWQTLSFGFSEMLPQCSLQVLPKQLDKKEISKSKTFQGEEGRAKMLFKMANINY